MISKTNISLKTTPHTFIKHCYFPRNLDFRQQPIRTKLEITNSLKKKKKQKKEEEQEKEEEEGVVKNEFALAKILKHNFVRGLFYCLAGGPAS